MSPDLANGALAYSRILRIAAQATTHRAFGWLHLQERRIRQWQREFVAIPAPPLQEDARATWFLDRFREFDLHEVHMDDAGNALGWLQPPTPGEPFILLSAHLDTVFPAGTPIDPRETDDILRAPGACDNGAGLAALLAILAAMRHAAIEPATNLLFAANTGEEAEGDLRGMRHLFHSDGRTNGHSNGSSSGMGKRILASIALEGAGAETVVSRGLGSRRFRVDITGPGGHAWTDAGTPNPIAALSVAIATLSAHPLPTRPRTVINVGRMEGGSSITSIPESASALVDIRSADPKEILLREVQLYRAVEDAVLAANARGTPAGRGTATGTPTLQFQITPIGDRPAGELPPDAPILSTVRAIDRHLQLRTDERIGSTDANIPIALRRNGIAMGAGGTGGGIHTTAEWYDSTGREIALRRILLTVLDLCSEEFRAQAETALPRSAEDLRAGTS